MSGINFIAHERLDEKLNIYVCRYIYIYKLAGAREKKSMDLRNIKCIKRHLVRVDKIKES